MFRPLKSQAGRSMIEMLGVLAIVGILTVGAIAMYSAAVSKFKLNASIEQIQALFTEVKDLYVAQADYTGLTSTVLYNANVLPTGITYNTGASIALNGWGGEVIVEPNGTDPALFDITYQTLPKDVCVKLSTKDWNTDLQEISINGTSVGLRTAGTLPVTIILASTTCGTPAGDSVKLTFR